MNPTEKEQIDEELLKAQQEAAQENEEAAAEAEANEELAQDEELHKELAKAEEKIADLEDKYLRLSAEFDNYRKRTLKERVELIKSASEKVITSILPVIDDMERAISNMAKANADDPMLQGIELIHGKFLKILEQEGLKKIDTKEKSFDTDFHEAIAMVPAPGGEKSGQILDCVQTGYTLNDKVIRHAKVAVAQ